MKTPWHNKWNRSVIYYPISPRPFHMSSRWTLIFMTMPNMPLINPALIQTQWTHITHLVLRYLYDSQYDYLISPCSLAYVSSKLNYHLYTPTPLPTFTSPEADTHFVPPSSQLRELLQKRNETIRGIAPIGTNLPEELQGYHTLVPLEAYAGTDRRKLGNWFSVVYRAIRSSDGMPYALRRVESKQYIPPSICAFSYNLFADFRLTHQSAFAPIEVWSNLRHPNIVSVKEAFTTRSFSDNCIFICILTFSQLTLRPL